MAISIKHCNPVPDDVINNKKITVTSYVGIRVMIRLRLEGYFSHQPSDHRYGESKTKRTCDEGEPRE